MVRHLSNERGFTFVELLAALLLLGILVAIAIPNYFGAEATARSKVDQTNVAAINAALALYKFKNSGACPAAGAAFVAFLGDTTNYFPDGVPVDPYCGTTGATCTSANPSLPYQNTFSNPLCRVQMSAGTPLVDHTSGANH